MFIFLNLFSYFLFCWIFLNWWFCGCLISVNRLVFINYLRGFFLWFFILIINIFLFFTWWLVMIYRLIFGYFLRSFFIRIIFTWYLFIFPILWSPIFFPRINLFSFISFILNIFFLIINRFSLITIISFIFRRFIFIILFSNWMSNFSSRLNIIIWIVGYIVSWFNIWLINGFIIIRLSGRFIAIIIRLYGLTIITLIWFIVSLVRMILFWNWWFINWFFIDWLIKLIFGFIRRLIRIVFILVGFILIFGGIFFTLSWFLFWEIFLGNSISRSAISRFIIDYWFMGLSFFNERFGTDMFILSISSNRNEFLS